MRKTIYLHIGMHKTASTYIQYGLTKNADLLSKLDYLYPLSAVYSVGHHRVPWQLLNHPRHDKKSDYLSELLKEINDSSRNNVLISSEVFSILPPKIIRNLHDLFKDFNVKIIIYIRNQVDWLQSMWGEIAKGRVGVPLIKSLNDWISDILSNNSHMPHGHNIADYLALINDWGGIFGNDSVGVKIYEQEVKGDIFKRFLLHVGIKDFSFLRKVNNTINVSSNFKNLELVRRARFRLREMGKDEEYIENAKKYILNLDLDDTKEKKIYISESNYDLITNKYSNINKMIADRYFDGEEIFSFDKSKVTFADTGDLKKYETLIDTAILNDAFPQKRIGPFLRGFLKQYLPQSIIRHLRRF